MKKALNYLESVPESRKWILAVVLLLTVIVPTLVNLLFTSEQFKPLLNDQFYFVVTGVIMYFIWLTVLFFLLKRDRLHLKHLSLTKNDIFKGLAVSAAILLLVNIALLINILFAGEGLEPSDKFSTLVEATKAVELFFFNIFLGAFVEEILCRAYLIPQFYLLICKKVRFRSLALLFALVSSQFLFALAHLPRDLFRFEVDLLTIISTQSQLFMSGIILSLVYLKTRNIIFLAFFHAFMNYGLPIVGTDPDFKLFYMVGAFTVTIFWGMIWRENSEEARLKGGISPAKVVQ